MQSAAEPENLPPAYVVLPDGTIKMLGPEPFNREAFKAGLDALDPKMQASQAQMTMQTVSWSKPALREVAAMSGPAAPVIELIAGHKFAGIGGCRCCVLPKQGGDGVELCGRYWDEIKDADGSWLNRADVAHVGGLNQTEIDHIRLEVKREADLRETMERATSDLAGRSLRG